MYQNSNVLKSDVSELYQISDILGVSKILALSEFQNIRITDVLDCPLYQNFWLTAIIGILTYQNVQYIEISDASKVSKFQSTGILI